MHTKIILVMCFISISVLLVGCTEPKVGRPVQNLEPGLEEAFTVEELGLYESLPGAHLKEDGITMFLWCLPLHAEESFVRSQERTATEHRYNETLEAFRDTKEIPDGAFAYHFMHSSHTCGVVANQALEGQTFNELKRIIEQHGFNYSDFKQEKFFDWREKHVERSDRKQLRTPGWATGATRYQ
jgi:hypothetical protein